MRTIKEINRDLEQARARVEQLDHEWNDTVRALGSQVDMVQRGDTVTLTFRGRVIKAKKNSYGHWVLREHGRSMGEFSTSMRLIRADLAQGKF